MTQDMFALSWYRSIYFISFTIFIGFRPLPWVKWRVRRVEQRHHFLPEHPLWPLTWVSTLTGATCRRATLYPPKSTHFDLPFGWNSFVLFVFLCTWSYVFLFLCLGILYWSHYVLTLVVYIFVILQLGLFTLYIYI